MSDDSKLQVTVKEGDSSLTVSKARSGLIARGRRDAEALVLREHWLSKARQLAEEGDADAQYDLGQAYYEGDGVPKDYAEAQGWFRKAAEQLHPYAISRLGDMYEQGQGVPADRAEAVRYYIRAADIAIAVLTSEAEHPDPIVQSHYLNLRLSLPKPPAGRDSWGDGDWELEAIGQGAEHGHAEAQFFAIEWLRRRVDEGGDMHRQFQLAKAYDNGWEGARNDTEAEKWYRKAADQGHAEAQCDLGVYYMASGEPHELAEAARLWRKAADQGHTDARYWLGRCYRDGEGVKQDYVEGVRWFRGSADRGHADAQFSLGCCYRDGEGVPQDYVLAHMWLNLSASNRGHGDQKVRADVRDEVASRMTPGQIAEAQRLAREWKPKTEG